MGVWEESSSELESLEGRQTLWSGRLGGLIEESSSLMVSTVGAGDGVCVEP